MAGLAVICGYAVFLGAVLLFGLDTEDRQIARLVRRGMAQSWRRDGRTSL